MRNFLDDAALRPQPGVMARTTGLRRKLLFAG